MALLLTWVIGIGAVGALIFWMPSRLAAVSGLIHQRPRRGVLGTSPLRGSRKFAANTRRLLWA
jgi:hypothetical protein